MKYFFSFAFCTFFKIFHVRLGKKSKSVSFPRVYVCVKAKLTLVSFFYFFYAPSPYQHLISKPLWSTWHWYLSPLSTGWQVLKHLQICYSFCKEGSSEKFQVLQKIWTVVRETVKYYFEDCVWRGGEGGSIMLPRASDSWKICSPADLNHNHFLLTHLLTYF